MLDQAVVLDLVLTLISTSTSFFVENHEGPKGSEPSLFQLPYFMFTSRSSPVVRYVGYWPLLLVLSSPPLFRSSRVERPVPILPSPHSMNFLSGYWARALHVWPTSHAEKTSLVPSGRWKVMSCAGTTPS